MNFKEVVLGGDPVKRIMRKAYKKANQQGFEGKFRDAWKKRNEGLDYLDEEYEKEHPYLDTDEMLRFELEQYQQKGEVDPYVIGDPEEYRRRKVAYADSLMNYNAAIDFENLRRLPEDSKAKSDAAIEYARKYFDRINYDDVSKYPSTVIKGNFESARGDKDYEGVYKAKQNMRTDSDKHTEGWDGWSRLHYEIVGVGDPGMKPMQKVVYEEKPKTYTYEISREAQLPNVTNAQILRQLLFHNNYNLNPVEGIDYSLDKNYKGVNEEITDQDIAAWKKVFTIEPYTKELTDDEANEMEKQGYSVKKMQVGGPVGPEEYFKSYLDSPAFADKFVTQWNKELTPYGITRVGKSNYWGIPKFEYKAYKDSLFDLKDIMRWSLENRNRMLNSNVRVNYDKSVKDNWGIYYPDYHSVRYYYQDVLPHELGHAFDVYNFHNINEESSPTFGNYPHLFNQINEKKNKNTEYYDEEHDKKPSETYADLMSVRYWLYKNGIFDSREKNKITDEQIDQARKKINESKSDRTQKRFFNQFNNEQIKNLINEIAYKEQKVNTAQNGGPIRQFQEGGEMDINNVILGVHDDNPYENYVSADKEEKLSEANEESAPTEELSEEVIWNRYHMSPEEFYTMYSDFTRDKVMLPEFQNAGESNTPENVPMIDIPTVTVTGKPSFLSPGWWNKTADKLDNFALAAGFVPVVGDAASFLADVGANFARYQYDKHNPYLPEWQRKEIAKANLKSGLGLAGAGALMGLVGTSMPSGTIRKGLKKADVVNWTDSQWDDAYNKAIKSGNITEAQRLRDLHFKMKAPNTKAVDLEGNPLQTTHGTNKTFNSFELEGPNIEHGDLGDFGYGHYFFPDKRISSYGDRQIYAYLNVENPYKGEWSRNFNRGQSGLDYAKKSMKSARDFGLTNMTDLEIEQELSKLSNADGVFAISPYNKRIQEIVVPKGEQIKSADAITYDDFGNIIPLSKRDNFNIKDIRYGIVPPALLIGTGAAAYNRFKKKDKENQIKFDKGGPISRYGSCR